MIEELIRDLRFGARSLARTPVVTIAAVFSIALGIAATTSVFGIVDAALFRPPPLERPGELAAIYMTYREPNSPVERVRWSWPRYRLLSRLNTSFEQVASFTVSVLAITNDGAEPVNAEVVSSAYLPVLRIQPIAGRTFTAAEDDAASEPVALIGHDLWQRRFAGERSVIGQTISLNGVSLAIVGILPRGFVGLSGRAQVWVPPTFPARATYAEYLTTNQAFISVVGRLKPGVGIERARSELATLGAAIDSSSPAGATAMTLNEARVDPSTRTPMLMLLAAVACLLLLSCANVAGLLLGRAVSRRREIGIRIATGASRGRIIQQLLVESAIIAVAGGAIGVLVAIPVTANAGLPAAMWRGRNFYGALGEFSTPVVDARVLFVAFAVCALTTLVFGLVPSLQATKLDVSAALKSGVGAATSRGRRFDPRRAIVGAEAALALILLVSGGLLAASWRRLVATETGFDRTNILTFLVRPSEVKYPLEKAPALHDALLAEIERLPGVIAASVDGCAPLGTGCATTSLYIVGRPVPARGEAPGVLRHYVGPNHFRTLAVPVVRGRVFDGRDRAGAPRVAIINQLAAKRFWPSEDPIGKRVWFGSSTFNSPDSSAEIVGIVGDVAYQALDARPFQPDFYTPYAQYTFASRTVLVRTRGDPSAMVSDIRRAVTRIDPGLAMFEVRTMEERMGDSWARLSYQTKLLSAFAAIALLLAATGIFAIVAHVIDDRRREIGVRVALGAAPVQVLTAVGESGARPALIGLCVGAIGAMFTGRALASAVYGVRAFDPIVIVAVMVVLTTVIVAAAYLAARRALHVEPVEALRSE